MYVVVFFFLRFEGFFRSKVQRFLVSGGLQLMLVEPDAKKVGWGVVKFVGLLQVTLCLCLLHLIVLNFIVLFRTRM